jgi:hypothetical protein
MSARFLLVVLVFIFSTSSISAGEEALSQEVPKVSHQERGSMSRSLAGGDKNGNPFLQESNSTPPKEPPQPLHPPQSPSAPKGLRIQTKSD